MKKLLILLCIGLHVQAQDTMPMPSILSTSDTSSAVQPTTERFSVPREELLLPHKMLFTQRVFWGPKGILRTLSIAPLTVEGREHELKLRRFMLISHQITGYISLAGFAIQGILATQLNKATGSDYNRLYAAQQTTLTITNIAYGTTALLSLTAPPKNTTGEKKANAIRLHKYLSIIHLTGFVATNILATKATQHTDLRPYQGAAAFTTLAAFAPALLALKF